jgi:hypothetical protein
LAIRQKVRTANSSFCDISGQTLQTPFGRMLIFLPRMFSVVALNNQL